MNKTQHHRWHGIQAGISTEIRFGITDTRYLGQHALSRYHDVDDFLGKSESHVLTLAGRHDRTCGIDNINVAGRTARIQVSIDRRKESLAHLNENIALYKTSVVIHDAFGNDKSAISGSLCIIERIRIVFDQIGNNGRRLFW